MLVCTVFVGTPPKHLLVPIFPGVEQVLFAWELQRRSGGSVLSVALHPGEVLTDVVRSLPGPLQKAYRLLLQTILLTPAQGGQGVRGAYRGLGRQAVCSVWC